MHSHDNQSGQDNEFLEWKSTKAKDKTGVYGDQSPIYLHCSVFVVERRQSEYEKESRKNVSVEMQFASMYI